MNAPAVHDVPANVPSGCHEVPSKRRTPKPPPPESIHATTGWSFDAIATDGSATPPRPLVPPPLAEPPSSSHAVPLHRRRKTAQLDEASAFHATTGRSIESIATYGADALCEAPMSTPLP